MIRNPNDHDIEPILKQLRAERTKLFHWNEKELLAGKEYLEGLLATGDLNPNDGKILKSVREHLAALNDLKNGS
jgi:hypothetical protein